MNTLLLFFLLSFCFAYSCSLILLSSILVPLLFNCFAPHLFRHSSRNSSTVVEASNPLVPPPLNAGNNKKTFSHWVQIIVYLLWGWGPLRGGKVGSRSVGGGAKRGRESETVGEGGVRVWPPRRFKNICVCIFHVLTV